MKALFLGLGSIGQRHLRNLRRLTGTTVEVLAYRRLRTVPMLDDRMQVVSDGGLNERYGVREIDDLDAALAERPDMVFVTNPSSLHLDVAVKAAEAGGHLFIEKPLATNWTGVEALMEIVDRRGLIATVAYQFRFHPGLRLIKGWLEAGRIGRLVSARLMNGEYMPSWHPYEDYRQSYAARSDLGGGALLTQIHELDMALWLFGRPHRLFCVGGHLSRLEVDVEDSAVILLECRHDTRPLPVTIELDYLQSPPVRGLTIAGDEGRIVWNHFTNTVTLDHRVEGRSEEHRFDRFDRNQMFLDELREFLDAVAGKGRPTVDLRTGAASLHLALSARCSLETGTSVALDGRTF